MAKVAPTPKMKRDMKLKQIKNQGNIERKKWMTLQVTTFILKKAEKVPQKPQLKCPVCETESILVIKILEGHLSTKHLSFVLKCSFCAGDNLNLFKVNYAMKRGMNHSGSSCDQCKKSFQFQCELKQHSNIHLPNSKKFKCTSGNCNRRYSSLKALKLHTKVHDEVDYASNKCNKIFNSHQNLSQHKCGMHGDGWVALCGCKVSMAKTDA